MRVLYLLNYAGKAGTERYVQTLIETLNHRQIEAYFVYHLHGLLVERLQAMGVPCKQLEMRSRFDRKAAKELSHICKDWGIDVIHTHYLRENYIAMLSKKWNPAVRVVYTSHFVMTNNWYTKLTNRMLSKKQDGVIAVCAVGKQRLVENGLDEGKIRVVFNGVDPEQFQNLPPSTLREELGIPKEAFVMLCASRFADDKGHAFLIDSVALLKQRTDRPFYLILAGDGDLQAEAKAQVEKLGLSDVVRFIGFRTDIKNLFAGSDLYVNSSRHEALSFLIIEAMASGLPVIATDMGGNSDIVNDQNQCGRLVPYDDPEQMASAMQTLMEDPVLLKRYQAGARQAVKDVFHVQNMAQGAYQLYVDVCKGKKGECV